jgi:hypothetical protein
LGHVSGVSTRIVDTEAAEILGIQLSNVARLVRKGGLHTERRRGGALDRAELRRQLVAGLLRKQ